MIISTSRWQVLQATLKAWNKTGLPFLTLENDIIFPIENVCADDPGINYFVPFLAKHCAMPLESALWWWDVGVAFLGAFIAIAGFWQCAQTKLQKVIVLVGVSLTSLVCWSIGDVYILPFFNVCLLPWLFVILQKQSMKKLAMWSVCAGLVVAFTNAFRLHAGWTLAIAALVAVVCAFKKIKPFAALCLGLFFGISMFEGYFLYVMRQRNAYLTEHNIPFGSHAFTHVFWHSTYLGLGFLQNEYGIYYGDSCGLEKVQMIDPKVVYCSTHYNQLLKKETLDFCKQHPHFVLRTLFAKSGILFYYFLLFANLGFLCALFYRKPLYIDCSYAAALAFSALPALLTIPIAPYLTGFFTLAAFYGIHSLLWALQTYFFKKHAS